MICVAHDSRADGHRVPRGLSRGPMPLKVGLVVIGTRGDVEPHVVLGRELQRAGAEVRLEWGLASPQGLLFEIVEWERRCSVSSVRAQPSFFSAECFRAVRVL